MDQMKQIFRSDSETEMPLLEDRQVALVEAGAVLMKVKRSLCILISVLYCTFSGPRNMKVSVV